LNPAFKKYALKSDKNMEEMMQSACSWKRTVEDYLRMKGELRTASPPAARK